ncbi:hypothetical protein [Salinigranum marinum]|uniref:amino acid kinase family protein n=1 Tax=Salinigranum marinum TaxID=1515595 RepID=UPI00298A04AA|nr:hypothetical protein [Salinigranum marinum]
MGDTSHETGTDPIVVALGGNTLLGAHGLGTIDEQLDVIALTARQIADAIQAGYDVVLTHGNGPQVGNLLLQQERVSETRSYRSTSWWPKPRLRSAICSNRPSTTNSLARPTLSPS